MVGQLNLKIRVYMCGEALVNNLLMSKFDLRILYSTCKIKK